MTIYASRDVRARLGQKTPALARVSIAWAHGLNDSQARAWLGLEPRLVVSKMHYIDDLTTYIFSILDVKKRQPKLRWPSQLSNVKLSIKYSITNIILFSGKRDSNIPGNVNGNSTGNLQVFRNHRSMGT